MSSAFGELVRLELPQIERPLSSNEDTDPVLCVRRLFIGCAMSSVTLIVVSWCDDPASEIARGALSGNFDGELWLLLVLLFDD